MTHRPHSSSSRSFDPVDAYDRDAAPKRLDVLWSLAGVVFIAAATMTLVDEEWPAPLVSESEAAESTAPAGLVPPRLNTVALTADFVVAPLSADDVRQLQTKLAEFGFSPGKVDGIAGPKTLGALNAYRSARNLAPVTAIDYGSAKGLLD